MGIELDGKRIGKPTVTEIFRAKEKDDQIASLEEKWPTPSTRYKQ